MQKWKVIGGEATGGILCRAGEGLKSTELKERLATGSTVEELQLIGKRLNFKLVEGSGPDEGWISIEIKGKELVSRISTFIEDSVLEIVPLDTPPDLDLGPAIPAAERPFDLVIYGATGFTGSLATLHLDALIGMPGATKHKWAIAGRNEGKLEELKKQCKTDVAIIVAKSEKDIHDMVNKCRVIVSCVGPHARWGEPVIRACVAFGTHYTDSSGESWWIKRMIARYDAEARKRGVMLVPMCGCQAVVADIGVHMLAAKFAPLRKVRGYVISFAFTTGGTDYNGRYTMQTVAKYPEVLSDINDPFSLGGIRKSGARPEDLDCATAEKDDVYENLWVGALGCAASDTRCVRRSCQLFEEGRTGRELSYGDDLSIVWRDVGLNRGAAERCCQTSGPLPSASAAIHALSAMQDALESGLTPPRGQGSSKEVREDNWTYYFMVGEGENGEFATCHCKLGENYEVTGMSTVTGALVLLEELDKVKPNDFGGLTTPAFAFAETNFAKRLMTHRWALKPKGAEVEWRFQEGKPDKKEIMKVVMDKTKAFTSLTQAAVKSGTKLFDVPDYSK